jgi:hypothetical protein
MRCVPEGLWVLLRARWCCCAAMGSPLHAKGRGRWTAAALCAHSLCWDAPQFLAEIRCVCERESQRGQLWPRDCGNLGSAERTRGVRLESRSMEFQEGPRRGSLFREFRLGEPAVCFSSSVPLPRTSLLSPSEAVRCAPFGRTAAKSGARRARRPVCIHALAR